MMKHTFDDIIIFDLYYIIFDHHDEAYCIYN